MPSYDYRCDACGHMFEKMQAMSAKIMRKCPKCKKLKLKRLIGSGGAVIVKGSEHPAGPGNGKPFRPPIEGRPEHIGF